MIDKFLIKKAEWEKRNSPFIKKKTFDKYHHESLNANDSAVTVTSGITRFSTKIEKKRKKKKSALFAILKTVSRKIITLCCEKLFWGILLLFLIDADKTCFGPQCHRANLISKEAKISKIMGKEERVFKKISKIYSSKQ